MQETQYAPPKKKFPNNFRIKKLPVSKNEPRWGWNWMQFSILVIDWKGNIRMYGFMMINKRKLDDKYYCKKSIPIDQYWTILKIFDEIMTIIARPTKEYIVKEK